uniref:Uncharacterized protein n=1 Tax=Globodera rostochiensis TaxID=31243 RepID=A0A914HYN7_GLORO
MRCSPRGAIFSLCDGVINCRTNIFHLISIGGWSDQKHKQLSAMIREAHSEDQSNKSFSEKFWCGRVLFCFCSDQPPPNNRQSKDLEKSVVHQIKLITDPAKTGKAYRTQEQYLKRIDLCQRGTCHRSLIS